MARAGVVTLVVKLFAPFLRGSFAASFPGKPARLIPLVQGRDELILARLYRRHWLDHGAVLIVQGCDVGRVGDDDRKRP